MPAKKTVPIAGEVKEKKSYSERYYTLSEDEMQELIVKAQAGDGRAQARLLEVFDNFISKYCSLLYRGKYDLRDYDIRRFIALFINDRLIGTRLVRNNLNSAVYKEVGDVMRGINYMVKRFGDELDVRQTVQLTFLQCVSRYKRKGSIPFSGFLYSYFFYLLKKHVDAFLIDQLGRKTFPLITEDAVTSSINVEDAPLHGFVAPPEPSVEDVLGPEFIDEFWVSGETAIFPFDKLTVQQRQLLKWRHVDGLKASQIAKKTTEHANTVRGELTRTRETLREIVKTEFDF